MTVWLAWSSLLAMLATAPVPLFDPVAQVRAGHLTLSGTTAEVVDWQGAPAVQVRFGHASEWPNLRFDAPRDYTLTDWSPYGGFAVTVTNPGDQPVTFAARVDDSPAANGSIHCRQGNYDLAPGQTATVTLKLASPPGMRGAPPAPPGVAMFRASSTTLDLTTMIAFQIYLPRPKADATLILHAVGLTSATANSTGFVDEFGQYNGSDWPGKLHAEADFATRRADEAADLAAHPTPPDRNAWGGWADGPQLEATGRFRAAQHEGRWWLVDPDGRLFWSAGITGVRPVSDGPIKGREAYFTWLPAADGPFAAFLRPGSILNFYGINLARKYGADYAEPWRDVSHRRLRSWGFTTIGNWSDAGVWEDHRTPYTVPVHYSAPGFQAGLRKAFPDVFDPRWSAALDTAMARASRGDDPWCVGYFIDNELFWGAGAHPLTTAILGLDGEWAAKRALLESLRERYPELAQLNAAWQTRFGTWDEATAPVTLDKAQATAAADDLARFEKLLAHRYFEGCRDAVRRHAPGALYLGCRFSVSTPAALDAAGETCDVVCFNIYNRTPLARLAQVAQLHGKPVIIGEFHFGALDRGMFHTGLGPTGSQEERAAAFTRYLQDALAAPWLVGAHWFQYVDQPLTGRFDGENYNIGWVTITDTPYPEMREAARSLLYRLYPTRASAPVEG